MFAPPEYQLLIHLNMIITTAMTVFDHQFFLRLDVKHGSLFKNIKNLVIQMQHVSTATHLASRFIYIRG